MAKDQLPKFQFHPDPVGTGSIEKSQTRCSCCGESRGYTYAGAVYTEDADEPCICPWCIASGRAHDEMDAEFMDPAALGGYGRWDTAPKASQIEVVCRTPAFNGWQQEQWWTHCGDAAAFLGRAGAERVHAHGPGLREHLRRDLGWESGDQFDRYVRSLSADGQPTAYLFRCLHCGEVGGYSDFA